MLVTINADVTATVATLRPQPSRASLRKRRIKKDSKGYVDLTFYLSLTQGSFVNDVNLSVVSDNLYPITSNIKATIYDSTHTVVMGSAIFTVHNIWHIGERVSFGDSSIPDGYGDKPLASIVNALLLTAPVVDGYYELTLVVRLEFDRDNFVSWDRGFFINPEEDGPTLVLDMNDASYDYREIFIAVENVIPTPCLQGIFLFGADYTTSQADIYIYATAFEEKQILISGYGTVVNYRSLLLRSATTVAPPPVFHNDDFTPFTQRELFWTFISGDPDSQRNMYFPCTDSTSTGFYINGSQGSDDFTALEIQNINTPMHTLDAFFESTAKDAINDMDYLYVDGTFANTLVFKVNLRSLSPTTPITITPAATEKGATTIHGHLACEGTNCITNATVENLTFFPDDSISTQMSGTTRNMLYFTFCNPTTLANPDPFYRLTFKDCSFLVPKTFTNSIDYILYLNMSQCAGTPIIIVFDTCLIGYDGLGSLVGFLGISRTYNVTILFKNCTFANPFGKTAPKTVVLPQGALTNTTITYANSIFWGWTYNTSGVDAYMRCFNGDPIFVNDIVGHPQFGKLETTSYCYRKWLPGYGQNIGWDQELPLALAKYNVNIIAYAYSDFKWKSHISTMFDIRDKFYLNMEAAFVKLPLIMDTRIITKFDEAKHTWFTEIPNIKTLIGRLTTMVDGSFPFSIDRLVTDIALLRYPLLPTNIDSIKEVISTTKVHTTIETAYDTQCPLILRYGYPEWWEPILGTHFYFFFDVFDNGTGVNLSSLVIEFSSNFYRYGSPEVIIEPLTADKTAYRIFFNPQLLSFTPNSIQEVKITIADCVGNMGPIWDNRRADEVMHWGNLTDIEKRGAMIPCNFTLNWKREFFFQEGYEDRFPAPRRNTAWYPIYEDTMDIYHPQMLYGIYSDSFEEFPQYNQAYQSRYLDWVPYTVDVFWG